MTESIVPAGADIEEDAFELFFRSSPRPMYVFDRQNLTFLEVNDSAAELYGYSRDELLRMSLVDIRPPEEVPKFLAFMREGASSGEGWIHRHRDGRLLHVETAWSHIPFHERDAQLVVVTDVTSREEARAELTKSEERFRAVFAASPIGIVVAGTDLSVIDANPSFCRLLGYELEEVLALTLLDITHPDDYAVGAEMARQLFLGHIPTFSLEKRYLTKAGEVIWANLSASAVHREDGTPLYAIGMVEDITARKQRDADALASAADASQLLATLTRRETEVLELVAGGLSARGVAQALTISIRTAESHLASIYRKLMVTGRDAASVRYGDLLSAVALPDAAAEPDASGRSAP